MSMLCLFTCVSGHSRLYNYIQTVCMYVYTYFVVFTKVFAVRERRGAAQAVGYREKECARSQKEIT